ncbi:MAG: DNA-binding MarR family transcriptional regulator [Cellvibrionaceae bacterium]|jgi:DNA-binding MarR family transcriptional regulator
MRKRDATLLAWFRFIRLLKKTLPQMDVHFKEWNLSQGQFDLLAEVAVNEGTNQQMCADRLNVTKGNVAQHLKNLENRRLMRREKIGRDNNIFLTDEGWALFSTIMPVHDEYVKQILASLTKQEIQQFSAILRKIHRSID